MSVAGEETRRKLAAIMSADVAGYSRLMGDDETATVATLREYRAAIARVVTRHQGRVVNAPGDNILAEFPSAVEAVQAACEVQQVLKGRNLELAPDRRMEFRIGINLGDVIEEEDGTIYGDGVNIAARMEALAEAGGICIASSIYDAVEGKLDFGFDFGDGNWAARMLVVWAWVLGDSVGAQEYEAGRERHRYLHGELPGSA